MNSDLPELRSILQEHGGASGSTSGNGNAGKGGIALNGDIANGASGSNAGKGGIALGAGIVADGISGTGNGNGQGGGVAINGGHTHQGYPFG